MSFDIQKALCTILLAEFRSRCEEEVDYNLSRYARDIGISASQLSEILSGKHAVTKNQTKKILRHLKMFEAEELVFSSLVKGDGVTFQHQSADNFSVMEQRSFRVASGWVPELRDVNFLKKMTAWLTAVKSNPSAD